MTVSVDDVAIELARPTPDSPVYEQWQSWIDRATRLIRNRLGVASFDALDPAVVDDVVLMAVVEHVRSWRESTASRYTVSVDDANVTKQFEKASGLLEIPDDLWPLLGVAAKSAAFTITPFADRRSSPLECWD